MGTLMDGAAEELLADPEESEARAPQGCHEGTDVVPRGATLTVQPAAGVAAVFHGRRWPCSLRGRRITRRSEALVDDGQEGADVKGFREVRLSAYREEMVDLARGGVGTQDDGRDVPRQWVGAELGEHGLA